QAAPRQQRRGQKPQKLSSQLDSSDPAEVEAALQFCDGNAAQPGKRNGDEQQHVGQDEFAAAIPANEQRRHSHTSQHQAAGYSEDQGRSDVVGFLFRRRITPDKIGVQAGPRQGGQKSREADGG